MSSTLVYLKSELRFHTLLMKRYKEELKKLPAGTLHIYNKKSGNTSFYYYRTDRKRRYLSKKKEEGLINDLVRKRFLLKNIKILEANIDMLTRYIGQLKPYLPDDIINEFPKGYQDLLLRSVECAGLNRLLAGPDVRTNNKRMQPYKPEQLIHLTANGELVRSKSEAIIAGMLYAYNIPYEYEQYLEFEEGIIIPDFMVTRPIDHRVMCWEHFGLTNDEEYRKSMDRKMETYRKHDIQPWNRLIVTYDGQNGAIDVQTIESIIKAFILCI